MVLQKNIAVRPHELAEPCDALFRRVHDFRAEKASRFQIVHVGAVLTLLEEVDLDCRVTFVQRGFASVFILLQTAVAVVGRDAPAELDLAGVGAQLAALLAAEKLIYGRIIVLAPDVPERGINCADRRHDDGAIALRPESIFVELFPDHLVVQRVHADDTGRVILEKLIRCRGAGDDSHTRFAETVYSLIRVDAADDGTNRSRSLRFQSQQIYARNSHSVISSFLSVGVCRRNT